MVWCGVVWCDGNLPYSTVDGLRVMVEGCVEDVGFLVGGFL